MTLTATQWRVSIIDREGNDAVVTRLSFDIVDKLNDYVEKHPLALARLQYLIESREVVYGEWEGHDLC